MASASSHLVNGSNHSNEKQRTVENYRKMFDYSVSTSRHELKKEFVSNRVVEQRLDKYPSCMEINPMYEYRDGYHSHLLELFSKRRKIENR